MEKKLPQYLHRKVCLALFDSDEWMIVAVSYFIASGFKSLYGWLLLFVIPAYFIPRKRRSPRGYFNHVAYRLGLFKIHGYPLSECIRFNE